MRDVIQPILISLALVSVACSAPPAPVVTAGSEGIVDLHPKKQKAEYAFRWLPGQSPLKSLDDTAARLRMTASLGERETESELEVRYFAIEQPPALPDGFKAILRRRGADGYTYKVRGSLPAPATVPVPGCAPGTAESEWDISVNRQGKPPSRKASLSCDGKGSASLPGSLAAQAPLLRPCTITMQRVRMTWPEHKDVKIEQWRFKPALEGAPVTELFEVSWKGKASTDDEAAFAALIADLPVKDDAKSAASKEEMAEACDLGNQR